MGQGSDQGTGAAARGAWRWRPASVAGRAGRALVAVAAAASSLVAAVSLAASSSQAATSSPFTSWFSAPVDHSYPYSSPTVSTNGPTSLSCVNSTGTPTTTLCVAADQMGYLEVSTTPTGFASSWASLAVDTGHAIDAVSCPSISLCLAVDNAGTVLGSSNPTVASSWGSVAGGQFAGQVLTSVACATVSLCFVGSQSGNVYVANGNPLSSTGSVGGWSAARVTGVEDEPVVADAGKTIESISCAASAECAAVDSSGRAFACTSSCQKNNADGGWSIAATVPTGGAALVSVSCVAPGSTGVDCAALDTAGNAYGFNGATWAAGVATGITPAGTPNPVDAVSCPAPNQCIAVGTSGGASVGNGASPPNAWTAVNAGAPYNNAEKNAQTVLEAASCPSAAQCVAIDQGGNLWWTSTPTSTSTAWTEVAGVEGVTGLMSDSCPAANLCVAGDASGRIITSASPFATTSAWSAPVTVDALDSITAISCPTTTLCVAADSADQGRLGNVLTSVNPAGGASAWSVPVQVDSTAGFTGLSCPTVSFCAGVDSKGDVLTTSNPTGGAGTWSSAFIDNPNLTPSEPVPLTSISCPSASLCVATTGLYQPGSIGGGYVFTATSPAGGAGAWSGWHVDGNFAINDVTCPSVYLCVAVDSNGDVLYSTNPTGGLPAWHVIPAVDTNATPNLVEVACPGSGTTVTCIALDSTGHLFASTNAGGGPNPGQTPTWSPVTVNPLAPPGVVDANLAAPVSASLTSLVCPQANVCLATDTAGFVVAGLTNYLSISTSTLPSGMVGMPYGGVNGVAIQLSGGLAPYSWSITGSLPAGITATPSGSGNNQDVLTGTPTVQGSSAFTVTVTDSSSPPITVSKVFSITVLAPWTQPSLVDCAVAATCQSPNPGVLPSAPAVASVPFAAVSCFNNFKNFCTLADVYGRTFDFGGFSPPATAFFPPMPADTTAITTDGLSCQPLSYSWFCAAVDGQGDALTLQQNSASQLYWSAPVKVSTYPMTAVSCYVNNSPPLFCIAGDSHGDLYAYNGTNWSVPVHNGSPEWTNPLDPNGIASVSCVSATFCVAVDSAGSETTFGGTSWTAPASIDASGLVSLSCASSTFCVGLDSAEKYVVYNGISWSVPAATGDANPLSQVSCPTSSFCAAVDQAGEYITYNGAAWTAPAAVTGNVLRSVSCTSSTFCLAADNKGDAFSYNGTNWTAATTWINPIDSIDQITAMSCISATLCIAGDSRGNILASTNSSSNPVSSPSAWAPVGFDDIGHQITGLSCPSSSLCVGTDSAGEVISSTSPTSGSSWSAVGVDSPFTTPYLSGVSCVTGSGTVTVLCIAVGHKDTNNNVNLYFSTNPTGGTAAWTTVNLGTSDLTGVSCPSTSLCVAVDSTGQVIYSTNPTGTATAWTFSTVDPVVSGAATNVINAIACPSTALCVAVDDQGNVITSTNPAGGGSTWTATQVDATSASPPAPYDLVSVSCLSTALCLAGDDAGHIVGSSNPSGGASAWWLAPVDAQLAGVAGWPQNCAGFPARPFCAAGGWSDPGLPLSPYPPGSINALSCVGTNFCIAADGAGMIATTSATPAVAVTTASPLKGAVTGSAYSVALAATGGSGSYTWSTQSALPPGLTLSTSGTLSGTPTAAGTYSFTVQVTDTSSPPQVAYATLSLTVTVGALSITTTSLPGGNVGSSYSATLAASGGTAPYSWSLAPGSSLPPGLSLSTGGLVSGTPSGTGTSTFTVQVADSSSPTNTASATLSITIGPALQLAITTTSLPAANVGSAYSATLTAAGGKAPYSWSVSSGTLPTGLSMSSSGVISGTPAQTAQSEAVGFTVTDSSTPPQQASATFTIAVQGSCGSNCNNGGGPPKPQGYWLLGTGGQVYAFGASKAYGSAGGTSFAVAVAMAATPDGGGYWVVDDRGDVQSFGDAASLASPTVPGTNVVSVAPTLDGKGLWEATSNGGVYTTGDAVSYGSMLGTPLAQPVVSIAATPDGKGYWMAAADGGVFAFGDAIFYGSVPGVLPPGVVINQPVVSIAATPDGKGYWMAAADGGVFTFGDAGYLGGEGGQPIPTPVSAMAGY